MGHVPWKVMTRLAQGERMTELVGTTAFPGYSQAINGWISLL